MVLLTLSKKVNQWLGPVLLRQGIKLRFALSGGSIRDNPWLDAALLLPVAQRLISVEVHDEARNAGGGSFWDSLAAMVSTISSANESGDTGKEQFMTLEHESAIRLQVLEKYLRPALVGPEEKWSSVRRWQFNSRLLKWARTEFLVAKHGPAVRVALQAFDSLRDSPQLGGKRQNQFQLTAPATHLSVDKISSANSTGVSRFPSSSVITAAFGMHDWSSTKHLHAVHGDMKRIASQIGGEVVSLRGGSLLFANIPDDANLSDLSMEEILEVAGGFVSSCGPFNALCEQANIYQLWSKEFVEQLGDYLLMRINAYPGETIILDMGAGDGILVHALREYYEKAKTGSATSHSQKHKYDQGDREEQKPISGPLPTPPPLFVATDDGSWSISQKAPVENLSVEEAMEIYADKPNRQIIVLCSWMPMDQDWTKYFRDKRVEEYVLIGECDDGQCGDNWLTWGNRSFTDDVLNKELEKMFMHDGKGEEEPMSLATVLPNIPPPRPYEVDGYKRKNMDFLLPYQFSRFDCAVSKTAKTISFRREDSPETLKTALSSQEQYLLGKFEVYN